MEIKEILGKINKNARRNLFTFLSKNDEKNIFFGSKIPKNEHEDRGTILFYIVAGSDFITIVDTIKKDGKIWREDFQKFEKNLDEIKKIVGVQEVTSSNEKACTYNPETHYIVSKKKTGRPKRKLTEDEKNMILQYHDKKFNINNISMLMGISNRKVMEVLNGCKK